MAKVEDVQKLTREQLNKLAGQIGIQDAGKASLYTDEALAKEVANKISPDKLKEFVDTENGEANPDSDTPAAEARTVQPGAPRLRYRKADGTIIERDHRDQAEEGEVLIEDEEGEDGTPQDKGDGNAPKPGNDGGDQPKPASNAKVAPAGEDGGDPLNSVENQDGVLEQDERPNPASVKLKNPTGRVVDVPLTEVTKRHLFNNGFEKVDGEDYPAEVEAELEEAQRRMKAQNLYTGNDQGDPMQSKSKDDVARRAGKHDGVKTAPKQGDVDGQQTRPRVAVDRDPKKPVSNVDQRGDGQIDNPQTGKPKRNTRLAKALNK